MRTSPPALLAVQPDSTPEAVADTASTRVGQPVTIRVLANDIAADKAVTRITAAPEAGRATTDGSSVTFTPAAGFKGIADLEYGLVVGGTVTSTARATVAVLPPVGTLVAVDDQATAAKDPSSDERSIDIHVMDNDVYPWVAGMPDLFLPNEGRSDHGWIDVLGSPGGCTGECTPAYLRYTPDKGYTGPDQFTYTLREYGSNPVHDDSAVVSINVHDPINRPEAVDDTVTVQPGASVTLSPMDNDVFSSDGDSWSYRVSLPATVSSQGGKVELLTGNEVRYTPPAGFAGGTDTFTYELYLPQVVVKGIKAQAAEDPIIGTVTVLVDGPVAVDDRATTGPGQRVTIPVLGNDSQAEGSCVEVPAQPAHGRVLVSDNEVLYLPENGFAGVDSFDYVLIFGCDGSESAHATVTVTVSPPEAADDEATSAAGRPVTVDLLANDTGAAGFEIRLGEPAHGTAQIVNADGLPTRVLYTPEPGFDGASDQFTYNLVSTDGEVVGSATVHITLVTARAADDGGRTDRDTPLTLDVLTNDTAPASGDAVLVVPDGPGGAGTAPSAGTVTVDASNLVTYTPGPAFSGQDSFTYTLRLTPDGEVLARATVIVLEILARDDHVELDAGTMATFDATDNDNTVGGLDSVLLTQSAHGTVRKMGREFEYTPAAGFDGADSFTYALTDGDKQFSHATVTITVRPVDDGTDPGDPGNPGGDPGNPGGDPGNPGGDPGNDPGNPGNPGGDPGNNPGDNPGNTPNGGDLPVTPPITTAPPTAPPSFEPVDPSEPPPPPPPPGQLGVDLDTDTTSPGAPINLSGSGCRPGEKVLLSLDGTPAARSQADPQGRFNATLPAPERLGRYHVSITCGASSWTSDVDVVVTTAQAISSPTGAAGGAAAAAILLFFLLTALGMNPAGRRRTA